MDFANPAAGGGGACAPAGGGWRAHLDPKARELNASMIFKTLKKHVPLPNSNISERLHDMARRFEDKIYSLSMNKDIYKRNIFQSILKIEGIKRKHHLKDTHRSSKLICLENNDMEMLQKQVVLAPAKSILNMQQRQRIINQQNMSLQPQLPGYDDALVSWANIDNLNINNHEFACQNSPPSSNLAISGRALASDAGNPIVDNAGRNLVIGTEPTVIIQPCHNDADNRHVEHETYAALFIEYDMKHWDREHILSSVSPVAKPHMADPICIYGNNYSAVIITVQAESTFYLPCMTAFKNHDSTQSFHSVTILNTQNNDNSDDENISEQVEQSNYNATPQPLVDPNKQGPSSGTGAMQRRISLQPVPIGKFRGKILSPTVHGGPITSNPMVCVKMHCGYFMVSAQGQGRKQESCVFRIPMQPLMDEGSVGLLIANICDASVGFITEIGTVDPMHQLTVIVDVLACIPQCVNNISLLRAKAGLYAQTEDPLPKLLSLTGPTMETGTADKFELPNPSENSSKLASADHVFSDLPDIETRPSPSPCPNGIFPDDEQNSISTEGICVDDRWPQFPTEQRIQDEKGKEKVDFSEDIPLYLPKHEPSQKFPVPGQPMEEVDMSFDVNQLLNLSHCQDPAANDTEMEYTDEQPRQLATQANMPRLQQHQEYLGAVPNVPDTQLMHRIQQTKAEVQQQYAQQPLTELMQPQSQQAQLQKSHQHNEIQQILVFKHPPMQQNFQSSADQQRHHAPLVDHHNQFLSQAVPGMPGTPLPITAQPEFTKAEGSQADVPTQDPTKILKPEKGINRLLKALRETPPQHLSAACSDMAKLHSQDNFIGYDTMGISKTMKRAMFFFPPNASAAGSVNYCTEPQSTTTSHLKRQKVMVEFSLMEEINKIENEYIDTILHVEDAAAANSEGAEGTIIKCTFTARHVCPALKPLFDSGKLSWISLRLLIPANYPTCSPVILRNFPDEQRCSDDLNTKAMLKLLQDLGKPISLQDLGKPISLQDLGKPISLQDLGKPISLQEIVKTWNDCVRAVILEYAQQTGGGSFNSTYGRWERCAGA